MNFSSANFRKAIALIIGLGMAAAWVGCSSSKSTPPPPTIAISATSGTPQNAAVGAAFGATLQATVTSNGSPSSGVSVTFTAPSSGASGTFATNPAAATDTETTNSNGVATSQVFTANDTAGSYNVTATTSGAGTGANYSLTNNAAAAATIAFSSPANGTESAVVSLQYAALAVIVTDSFSNPVSGQSVTFTVTPGATGASAAFATTGATDTETTGANGIATTSQALTANATTGSFTVAASSGSLTPVNFTLTNTASVSGGLAAGNYVFSVQGTDSGSGNCANITGAVCIQPYSAAGVFTVNSGGTITIGEMSFSDFNYYAPDGITGGSVAASPNAPADTNLIITINTSDPNIGPGGSTGAGTGTLVFNASMASTTRGLISEYDSWATSTGELDAQTSTAALCPNGAVTPCGYAFDLAGLDSGAIPMDLGGVAAINGAGGTMSGAGTVFDLNDGGTLSSAQVLSSGSVGAPDAMGYVVITLNDTGFFGSDPGIVLDGYIVDSSHIRVVEAWLNLATGVCNDALCGATGGTMLAQTGTGGFNSASISGSSVVVSIGGPVPTGPLQVAGILTFNSGGTVSGNLSFNDISAQSPQGGSTITGGTWSVDVSGTGRVTAAGVTDGATFTYNLQLYLTGDGHATVISMDTTPDVLAGHGWTQAAGLGVSSLNGTYALALDQFSSGVEFNGNGSVVANAGTLTGFTDENGSLLGLGTAPDTPINFTYTGTASSPIISLTGGGGGLLTLYLVDGTQGVVIENDTGQLTLGYATNQ